MTSQDALAAWLEHLAHERRLSPRTLEAYGHIGRLYLAFLERHRGGPQSAADPIQGAKRMRYVQRSEKGKFVRMCL